MKLTLAWVSAFILNIIITMIAIYYVKKVSIEQDIPFMRKVAEAY